MVDLRRLIVYGVLAVAACWGALLPLQARAHGVTPPTGPFLSFCASSGQPPTCGHGSSSEAAAADVAYWAALAGPDTISYTLSDFQLVGDRGLATYRHRQLVNVGTSTPSVRLFGPYTTTGSNAACGPDAASVGGQCVCNAGFQPGAGGCVPINCQAVASGMQANYWEWTGNTSSFCWGGCKMECAFRGFLSTSGKSSCEGFAISTSSEGCQGANGGLAGGNDAGAGPAPPDGTCPRGQCPGTINGQRVCVPCSSNSASGGTSSASPAPGNPTGAAPPLPGAPPGATEKREETTCTGNKCTTTGEFFDSGGNSLGKTEDTKPKEEFCAKNPNSPLCKEGAFGGGCGAFTCSGDGVQCAMARVAHENRCRLEEVPEGVGATYDALKGSGQATGAGSSTLSLAQALPSGPPNVCAVQDFSITVFDGVSWTVPLGTRVCPHLATIRSVVSAFGALAWVLIVFRG